MISEPANQLAAKPPKSHDRLGGGGVIAHDSSNIGVPPSFARSYEI